MSESCCRTAEQVKKGKPDRAHSVFNVVAENPKGPHIGYDMEQPAVQELMRQKRPKLSTGKPTPRAQSGWRNVPARDRTVEKLLN